MAEIVGIQILGRTLKVNCPPDEQAALEQAVINLNQRLQELKQRLKVSSNEQLVTIVALNLCNELLKSQQKNHEQLEIMVVRMAQLQNHLERAMIKTKRSMSSV